ncbi:MAG: TonB-dependent receptor [Ignavibacteriae bacterium]|nr:TonB-dependent receptor [Ignavibacteriota bacterium]
MRSLVTLFVLLHIVLLTVAFGGTTGKIVGTATDARSGEKLVSVNVVVQGTTLGATSNIEGYFSILNIPPGKYTVQASIIGYTSKRYADVVVEIDQTTTLNIKLSEEAIEGQEVTVVAERPVVQPDVSSSVANITAIEVAKLPTASVVGVVSLQAGVQSTAAGDLLVRGSGGTANANGGGSDRTVVLLNGLPLRDGRDNSSFFGVSLSSIENLQVTAGGFSAEYGQVRSGLVNIVTKEGSPSRYTFGGTARYRPAAPKHFGSSIYDNNSYFIRPFVDPAVCWTGTGTGYEAGAWDKWTREQYQSFGGWNAVAQATLTDNDPTNDLTPQAAQKLFLWQHRRQVEVSLSDYDIDAGFGGPLLPGLSTDFGNLRFFGALRKTRSAYLIPLSDSAYNDQTFQLKLTSDIAQGMKLSLEALYSEAFGTNDNQSGAQGIYTSPSTIADNVNYTFGSYTDARIFTQSYFAPSSVRKNLWGLKFTHMINSGTFYDVKLSMFRSKYNTLPGTLRNNARIYKFGNDYYVDEAPFGFQVRMLSGNYTSGEGIGVSPGGLRMAGGLSTSRDASIVTNYTAKIDFTSQLDRYNQLQFGGEFTLTDSDVNYGTVDSIFVTGRTRTRWHEFPKQAALYAQEKLEFEGMVANIGLRLDYSYAGGEWYEYDQFNKYFAATSGYDLDTLLTVQPTKKNVTLSPRLGVAFPITENSKLFFNYGHFRSLPTPENLFLIRRTTDESEKVTRIANPNNLLPRTIQYELGYEQNFFDAFMTRVSGYYKDILYETRLVTYDNLNGTSYDGSTNNAYRDIRGFEITLQKNRGDWIQGFLNYTYDVRSYAYFGYTKYVANKSQQGTYEAQNITTRVSKPVPLPYARANVDFYTPPDFGPGTEGLSLLGDWRINLTGRWTSGYYFTWDGGISTPGLENNAQWRDSWGADMRISKSFRIMGVDLQVFADITNLFNIKNMSEYGFVDLNDRLNYFKSLHMPEGVAGDALTQKLKYPNIPGDDRPGDYRQNGAAFQPVVVVANMSDLGSNTANSQTRPFYYVANSRQYYQLVNGSWQEVESARLQKVLDDKAYIDMPNLDTFSFLNPRNIFYGIRLSFDL